MMDAIERAAHLSVGRACGFCGLAILCCIVGFSTTPHLAARVGGSFALVVALVLIGKAMFAERVSYKNTETWLLLLENERPPKAAAQTMISTVLRRVYLVYARYCAVTAVALIVTSMVLGVVAVT